MTKSDTVVLAPRIKPKNQADLTVRDPLHSPERYQKSSTLQVVLNLTLRVKNLSKMYVPRARYFPLGGDSDEAPLSGDAWLATLRMHTLRNGLQSSDKIGIAKKT